MYEYRQLGIISGDVTRLNELAAEGWRVVAHVPTGDHLYHFLLEREKGDTIRELQTRVAELETEKRTEKHRRLVNRVWADAVDSQTEGGDPC